MVNSIINAVTKQLGTTFGNSYHYYKENIEQGFTNPCFHVGVRLPIIRSRSPVLYDRTMPVVVHYFSDSKTDKVTDCYDMGEKVVECLEYLPFMNTLLRGEDINYQIVDDVLQVFITYKFITKRVTDSEDSMESIVETVTHTK